MSLARGINLNIFPHGQVQYCSEARCSSPLNFTVQKTRPMPCGQNDNIITIIINICIIIIIIIIIITIIKMIRILLSLYHHQNRHLGLGRVYCPTAPQEERCLSSHDFEHSGTNIASRYVS